MYSKGLLATLIALSFSSMTFAQSSNLHVSKKKARAVAATTTETTTNTTSMAAPQTEKKPATNAAVSEYAYQPQQGRAAFTFTPQVEISSVETNIKPLKQETTTDTRTSILMIRAQRGLADDWSLSGSMGVGTSEIEPERQKSATSSGPTDITIGAQKIKNLPQGQLFYGANFSLSPGDHEDAYSYKNGKSSDGNMFSGGSALAPFVGIQSDRRDYIIGARSEFKFAFDRSISSAGPTGIRRSIATSNEHLLSVEGFFERPTPQMIFGAKVGITHALESDMTVTEGSDKLMLGSDVYQVLNAGIYAKFQPNPNVSVLPNLTFSKLLGSNGGSLSVENVSEVNIGLAVRAAL